MPSTAIVWFRRDLRVHDHPALTAAAGSADRVVPAFVLDERLLVLGAQPEEVFERAFAQLGVID